MRAIKLKKTLFEKMYLSYKLDWFFDLLNIPRRIYNYIDKFIYYGFHGAKTYDYETHSSYYLMYVQIKRVRKFMDSDKTHLMWNSDGNNKGLIRKLYEFEELLKRKYENDLTSYYYIRKFHDQYRHISLRKGLNELLRSKEYKLASKKDAMVSKGLEQRFKYMLDHYLEMFWD